MPSRRQPRPSPVAGRSRATTRSSAAAAGAADHVNHGDVDQVGNHDHDGAVAVGAATASGVATDPPPAAPGGWPADGQVASADPSSTAVLARTIRAMVSQAPGPTHLQARCPRSTTSTIARPSYVTLPNPQHFSGMPTAQCRLGFLKRAPRLASPRLASPTCPRHASATSGAASCVTTAAAVLTPLCGVACPRRPPVEGRGRASAHPRSRGGCCRAPGRPHPGGR